MEDVKRTIASGSIQMILALATLISSLTLSAAAAYYSVVGLMTIFAGSALAVALMASAMEAGKIVSVVWLHYNWTSSPKVLRAALTTAVVVLMGITSMGIYGFLSKAYYTTTENVGSLYIEQQSIQTQLDQIDKEIERNNKVISQMDSQVDALVGLGRLTASTTLRKQQQNERTSTQKSITELQASKNILIKQKNETDKSISSVEVEVGPIKYVAKLLYGEESSQQRLDDAVAVMIMLLIFVFDFLAVLLMIASQLSFNQYKKLKLNVTEEVKETAADFSGVVPTKEVSSHALVELDTTDPDVSAAEEVLTAHQKMIRDRIKKKKQRSGGVAQM